MMNDLVPIAAVSWAELQQHVYLIDGSWRDVYVLNASRADWKIWAEFVNANYPVEFFDGDGTLSPRLTVPRWKPIGTATAKPICSRRTSRLES